MVCQSSQNLKNVDLSIVVAASGATVTFKTVWVVMDFQSKKHHRWMNEACRYKNSLHGLKASVQLQSLRNQV